MGGSVYGVPLDTRTKCEHDTYAKTKDRSVFYRFCAPNGEHFLSLAPLPIIFFKLNFVELIKVCHLIDI